MRRFVSEGPTLTSARFVGGNSIASFEAQNDTKSSPNSSESSNRHGSRITNETSRVMHSSSNNDRWNVKSVRPVPTYYPLEKTCITVHCIPLNVICSRISNFMRMNSIACHYHNHSVECQTMGLLKFVVHLWKASRTTDDGVIVEIQRRQGCSIVMQHVRHGLVQAITTDEAPVVVCEQKNTHMVDCNAFQQTTCEHKSECLNALKITNRLLQSDQYDQNRLGMESMLAMTSPTTVHMSDARLVSKALVYGDAPLGDCLRDAILPYFQDTEREKENCAPAEMLEYDSDADEDEEEYVQGCHFGSMHNLVLQVLANALQVAAELPDSIHASSLSLVDLASPFWNTACNALVYNIEVANHRPREAALSAKCLNLLARLAPVICDCPVIDRLATCLPSANEYGKGCNLLLERESHKLMGTLAGAS